MASHDGWQRTVGGDWTREIGNGVKATVRIDHWEALLGEDDDLGYWSCGENDVGMEFSSRAEAESYLQALLEDWAMESGDEFDSIEWGRYLSGESVRGVACGHCVCGRICSIFWIISCFDFIFYTHIFFRLPET